MKWKGFAICLYIEKKVPPDKNSNYEFIGSNPYHGKSNLIQNCIIKNTLFQYKQNLHSTLTKNLYSSLQKHEWNELSAKSDINVLIISDIVILLSINISTFVMETEAR